ncbi:hypothetical protein KUTeg_021864 [Tegillarca granosa]|uniref:Uncharacterized protein n=1 Tax=Tegillarca granosa TaxID=220873 RepID=A0ABQ9EA47_TEGGR|nr:hypothetical protein KUTeg_021864 [Tegillarca granosa]
MNTEAQRLVSLSLGKIAASRSQRGGINLHKNLLVASVLHKARTAYMMENLQTMLAKRQAQAGTKVEEKPAQISTDSKNNNLRCDATTAGKRSQGELDTPKVSKPCDVENKENSPPKCARLESENSSVREDKLSQNSRVENIDQTQCGNVSNALCTPRHEVNDYVNKQNSCTRCVLKRRRGSHDSTTTDNENSEQTICSKKLRLDINQRDNEQSLNCTEEMQTDSPQITSLVSIFNTGFSGLCSNTGNSESTDNNNNNSHVKSHYSSDSVSSYNLHHSSSPSHKLNGYSLDSNNISSCGTELIDHKLESVSMPTAIALTV